MPVIPIPGIAPLSGYLPLLRGLRNGVAPPGPGAVSLGAFGNAILAKRLKVQASHVQRQADCYNTPTAADTWRFRFRTSPNAIAVIARHILLPVDDTLANAPDPRMFWTVGGVAQDTIYASGPRVTALSTIVPDEFHYYDQQWNLDGATTYEAVLNQADKLRCLGVTIYELVRTSLDTASDVAVDQTTPLSTQPIFDRESADIFGAVAGLYDEQGSNFVSWTQVATTARTTTSATYVNVLNTAITAVGTNNPGWPVYPQFHGMRHTYNSGTNRESVPIVLAAYIATSDAGQTVTVALCDANNDTSSPIATVTRTGATTGAWVAQTAEWTAPSNATALLQPFMKITGGATASVRAIAVYRGNA